MSWLSGVWEPWCLCLCGLTARMRFRHFFNHMRMVCLATSSSIVYSSCSRANSSSSWRLFRISTERYDNMLKHTWSTILNRLQNKLRDQYEQHNSNWLTLSGFVLFGLGKKIRVLIVTLLQNRTFWFIIIWKCALINITVLSNLSTSWKVTSPPLCRRSIS